MTVSKAGPWALLLIVVSACPSVAADALAAGKIKGINADKKEFVLTDNAGKDWTFKMDKDVVINRGGNKSQSDLKPGDAVNVCYHKGLLNWTAHYVLVQEGDTKNCVLVHGTIKNYDADKNHLTITDQRGTDEVFPVGDAKIVIDGKEYKVRDIKIGDDALAIVDKKGEEPTLKSVMVDRGEERVR